MHVVRANDLTSITNDDALVLNGVDLTIDKGSVFGLAGPQGAGKTALLRLLLGLRRPTAGTLLVLGEPMGARRADLRRRVGFVATRTALPERLTVTRFLEFSGELAALPRVSARQRLARIADRVGLTEVAHTPIRALHEAMRTRIAIAAALMSDPELLLLDAPTEGLPPSEAHHVVELIRSLSGPDRTIVVASRRLDELERLCSDIAVLNAGRVAFQGPAAQLRELARQSEIHLEVDGHLAAFERALAQIEQPGAIRIERAGTEFAITGLGPRTHADYLRAIVEAADRTGVEILRIDASGGDLSSAYLDRLEADRRDGSLRAAAWTAAQAHDSAPDRSSGDRTSGDRSAEPNAAPERELAEAGDD